MKHTIYRLVAIVVCLCILFTFPAAAAEISQADARATLPYSYLATFEASANNARFTSRLFTMEATAVYDFLSSGSTKSFYITDLPSGAKYIGCWGNLYHSLASQSINYRMYAGYCYYNSTSLQYERVIRWEFRDGDPVGYSETKTAISSLNMNSYTKYYGFIKNDHPSGSTYVSGNVYFFCSDS